MAKIERIAVVGKSSVGRTLAKAIRESSDYELAALVSARSERYPKLDCDVLLIATRDDKIAEVAERALTACVKQPNLIAHTAGSVPSTILPVGPDRLTLHPLQTFAKPSVEILEGIYWMASSEESSAIRWAKKFTKAMGGAGLLELKPFQLPLYHTVGVFASNFLVLLGGALEEITVGLGQNQKRMKAALRPLMQQALINVTSDLSRDVLSGPIARKDQATIRKHQRVLKELDPELRKLYDAFLRYALSRRY